MADMFWNAAAFLVGVQIVCMTLGAAVAVALIATEVLLRLFGHSLGLDLGAFFTGDSYDAPASP